MIENVLKILTRDSFMRIWNDEAQTIQICLPVNGDKEADELTNQILRFTDLKNHIDKRIAELDKRISIWNNFTQAGQIAYNMIIRELQIYQEIYQILDTDKIPESTK